MTKFHTPQMSVIRFIESDVIVASNGVGKTLTISGTYNNTNNDALYVLGNGQSFNDNQVTSSNSTFLSTINSYIGGVNFATSGEIRLVQMTSNNKPGISSTLYGVALHDMYRADNDSYYDYNGVYTWDGSNFARPYQQ